jgi:hypothetical protein
MVFLSKAAAAQKDPADQAQAEETREHDNEEPLHVASRLHAFNRFELKYLVPVEQAAEIRDELAERMDRDLHSPVGGYGVWSLYLDGVTDESPVCVEIKQRVNRVTQKRRITLPYGVARQLCDGREMVRHSAKESAFIQEVLELVVRLNLQPTAITGYQREALVGRDADTGLRVTFDRRIRGRDRDFHFGTPTPENRFTIPPHMSIMEIKVNERTPYWITDLTARRSLNLIRVSKYVQSIEAFGLAPRSVFHVNEADYPPPTPTEEQPPQERPAQDAPLKVGAQ